MGDELIVPSKNERPGVGREARAPRPGRKVDSRGSNCYPGLVRLVDTAVAQALEPFGVTLSPRQLDQVSTYVERLVSWGRAVNLTAIHDPEQILRRHFAESMYITGFVHLEGCLLDVGTGAGFPGLALKIICPELYVTLLEPVAKKRAFLKEVVRECQLELVEVRGESVEGFCITAPKRFDFVTLRAVGSFETVLPSVRRCLAPAGRACLWLTGHQARRLAQNNKGFAELFEWEAPVAVPLSQDREIWCGRPRVG
jgi:16S rRNA (guanine527-N7)-methyltransferase